MPTEAYARRVPHVTEKGYTSCTILRNGLSGLFHHASQSKSSLCHNGQGGCYYKTVFRVSAVGIMLWISVGAWDFLALELTETLFWARLAAPVMCIAILILALLLR
jgi:hypothetical protein